MLVREHRFHGLGSLNFAYKQGKVIRGDQFSLKYARNPRRQTYRVAVVVSKKVAKSAVVRNRIRRKIFAAVRLSDIAPSANYDLIFSIYNSSVAEASATDLQSQVQSQLRRAGII